MTAGIRRTTLCAAVLASCLLVRVGAQAPAEREAYLSWSARDAEAIGRSTYKQGRVGGLFDTRFLSTDRSYNYRLAATWLTPDVIKAAARLAQIQSRLSVDATRQLVTEAEAAGDTVVLVEIDPREGSGVIPLSWDVFLQPKGASPEDGDSAAGRRAPELRNARALAGTQRRNYAYDRFWVVFPLTRADGTPLFQGDVKEAELVVRIHDKEGRVDWRIPDAIRHRIGMPEASGVGSR